MQRQCKVCQKTKDLESFGLVPSKKHRRRVCYLCRVTKDREVDPEKTAIRDAQRLVKKAVQRRQNPDYAIWIDTRSADRKKGLEGNDLDRAYISELILRGCAYCGDTSLRMTLDRKDNSQSHHKNNVLPCCIRCNYLKGSMPQEAWLKLAPTVKEVREAGLFGDWRSEPLNRKYRG